MIGERYIEIEKERELGGEGKQKIKEKRTYSFPSAKDRRLKEKSPPSHPA